ncbi:hypothetical protein, partial [Paenibacillus polymyxa]|uniref:hypothetical protein n=1 Tax=Paenibacillus polymyxa TaxID=1406 RepID=UPI002AB458E2
FNASDSSLQKKKSLFHHPFVQFSKNLSVLVRSTSQELDHIMLVAFLSNLFLIIFSVTSLQEMLFSKQRLIIYHA